MSAAKGVKLPPPRPLVIVQGRGTPGERRTVTATMLYPVLDGGVVRWVTVPGR